MAYLTATTKTFHEEVSSIAICEFYILFFCSLPLLIQPFHFLFVYCQYDKLSLLCYLHGMIEFYIVII
jgi:hypothetical protein